MKLIWLFPIVLITTGVRKPLPVYDPICEKRQRRSFSILVFHSKLNTPCAFLTKTVADTLWHKCQPGVSCHFVTQTLGRGVFRGCGSRSSGIYCRCLLFPVIAFWYCGAADSCQSLLGSPALFCQSFPFTTAQERLPTILIIHILLAVVQETMVEIISLVDFSTLLF